MANVLPPDIELWLTGYLRSQFPGVQVSNKEPDTLSLPLTRPLIVVRDDGGPRLSWMVFDRSVGVSVLAGTRRNDQPVNDLARRVAGALMDDDIAVVAGSPVVGVNGDGCLGPYAVVEQLDVARRYLAVQYEVSGSVA